MSKPDPVTEITWADFTRLLAEVSEGDKGAWLDKNQIDPEVITRFCDYLKNAVLAMSVDPELGPSLALDGAFSFAFQVGFDLCEQVRPRAGSSDPRV